MQKCCLVVTRKDKFMNEHIRGTLKVDRFGQKVRQSRLRWYGHEKRQDDGYMGRCRCQEKENGETEDVVEEDMWEAGTREDEVFDRNVWRIRCRNL